MINLGSKTWGTSPSIPISFAYEKKRSGASMGYRIKVTISAVTGASYFGYPIYLKWTMAGVTRETKTLKAASPSQWSSAITYTSPWFWVSNKITGTTPVSFNVYSGSGSSRNNTYSYSMAIDPAASEITAKDGDFEEEQILTVKQYDTSFSHSVEYYSNGYYGTIYTKGKETSIPWTPPIEIANASGNATWFTVNITIITYDSAGNTVGSNTTVIKCYVPAWAKPSVSLSFTDTSGSFEKYGKCVQGKSALDVKVSADGVYSSVIRSQSVSFDGKSYTEAEFTTDVIKGTGDISMTATVKDSRNRSNDTEVVIPTMEYEPPKITGLKVRRSNKNSTSNSAGEYLAVDYSVVVSPLENKNTAKLILKYKKTTEPDSAYVEEEISILDGTYVFLGASTVFAAEPTSSYDIILVVEDDFYNSENGNAIEKGATGSSVQKLFSWLAKGLGWAFGKVAEMEGVLDIAFKTYFRGGIFQPKIPLGKDLDEIIIPNTYSGLEASTAGYLNCPIEEGEFTLEVLGEEEGNLTHRLTVRNKYEPIIYERHKINGSWGGWLRLIVAVGDYIEAYGSSSIWRYEKWSSGKAVCWGVLDSNTEWQGGTTTFGDALVAYSSRSADFPVELFADTPLVFPAANDKGAGVTSAENDGTTADTCAVTIFGKDTAIGSVSVFAIGRWK